MGTKHTPGEWQLLSDLTIRSREFSRSAQMADYRGCIVADLGPALGASNSEPEEIAVARRVRPEAAAEMDANARLITAAPDYHKAVADLLDLWPLSGYELEAYMAATFIPAVRAAQNKANGK